MIKQVAIAIIEKEGLGRYNIEGQEIKENEVGIKFDSNGWTVYYTDEKANLAKIKTFLSESEAIERLIECLRVNKRIIERRKKRTNL
jgi:hypothetical protein